MKPAPFDYHAPRTLEAAVALLERFEREGVEARILAGGQSLMPMLAMRVARPQVLVDLGKVAGLADIRAEGDAVVIGAMATKSAVEESALIRSRQPLFHAATRLVGHRQIRNRGSVGGSFAHADPASEYPAVALVQDLQFCARGPAGERWIPAAQFFVSYMTTSLEPTEVLTEVRLPALPPGTGWAIQEFTRRHGDLALAGIAVTLRRERGRCSDVRIAAFGVNATAVRLPAAEQALQGQPATAELFARGAAVAAESVDEPMSCIHASADYRRQLVKVLARRCLEEAANRAA